MPGELDKYALWARSSNWLADDSSTREKITEPQRVIVTDRGSLTQALKSIDQQSFQVKVLSEKIDRPHPHEQLKLARDLAREALIREVELCVYGTAVVFARSIIPLSLSANSLATDSGGLAGLGTTPLGQVLFTDGNIRVSKRDYLFFEHDERPLIARRTPYEYHGKTILVSEFFLPALQHYI